MQNQKPESTKLPATLGESVYVLKRERRTLPDRAQIGKLVQSIIDEGHVQKILLQVGHPIIVERYVAQGGLEQTVEEDIDGIPMPDAKEDLYFAVRNADMEELRDSEKFSPLEVIFRAFVLVSHRRLKPHAFLAHSSDVVNKWLHLDQLFGLEELFGLPLISVTAIPEGTVLLTASGENGIELSIRISLVV